MKQCFQALIGQGIAPVISLSDERHAIPLAQALLAGGITNVEITLRTAAGLKSIEKIKKAMPMMTVSAGTVLTLEKVSDALQAGADYVVTPGCNRELVAYCTEHGIGIIPGCTNASDIDFCISRGLEILKYFPVEPLGGIEAIKLLAGPYPQALFLPTGGLTLSNIGQYLACPAVAACGGSYMANAALIEKEEWETITDRCRKAMDISLGFDLAHIGVNCCSEEEAMFIAKTFSKFFRMSTKNGHSSVFAGTVVEMMKQPGRGSRGHIGFYTNSCERAKYYFENSRIPIDESSYKMDAKNRLKSFYLQEEVAGFALHVITR